MPIYSQLHNQLMLNFSAAIVAVADHARSDVSDKTANEKFIRAMQALADDQREFCRRYDISKSLRVVSDPSVTGGLKS